MDLSLSNKTSTSQFKVTITSESLGSYLTKTSSSSIFTPENSSSFDFVSLFRDSVNQLSYKDDNSPGYVGPILKNLFKALDCPGYERFHYKVFYNIGLCYYKLYKHYEKVDTHLKHLSYSHLRIAYDYMIKVVEICGKDHSKQRQRFCKEISEFDFLSFHRFLDNAITFTTSYASKFLSNKCPSTNNQSVSVDTEVVLSLKRSISLNANTATGIKKVKISGLSVS